MEKFKIKSCKTHGDTEHVLEARGYYRCKRCRTRSVAKKRKNLKIKAVEYLGGKCTNCGYSRSINALEFHHITDDKSFTISAEGYTRGWARLKLEIDKCTLLCANCHRELHDPLLGALLVGGLSVKQMHGGSNPPPAANYEI